MHAVNLISSAIRNSPEQAELPVKPVYGICAVTGEHTLCLPRNSLFGKSFTNCDVLAAPESLFVSVDAYVALKYKWERMSSWRCDGESFTRLDRQGVRQQVLSTEYVNRICCYYATTSYKKHGALRTPINKPGRRVWIFEERAVDCSNMTMVLEWWSVLDTAIRAGIGRSIIETLECSPYAMSKVTFIEWLRFERWARPRYLSPLYAFLTYLLPSIGELNIERHEIAENTNRDGQLTLF